MNIFKFHFARMQKPIIFALPITEWNELVAQLVEQYTFNVWALGSSPSGFTLKSHLSKVAFSIYATGHLHLIHISFFAYYRYLIL